MDKIIIPQTLATRITVKKVKNGFGHDLLGIYADIYLDKKKVGYYNDDGWGGEVDIQLTTDARKTIEDKLLECNYAQQLFDNGFDFMGDVNKIPSGMCVQQAIYTFIEQNISSKEAKKFQAKLNNDMHRGICIGNDNGYRVISFKAGNLKRMVEIIGVKGVLLQIKLQIIPNIKKGDRILNTNLKDLGIDLDN